MSGRYPRAEDIAAVYAALERLGAAAAAVPLARVKDESAGVAATKVRVIVSLLKDLGILKEQRGALVRLLRSGVSGGALTAMADDYRVRQSGDREKLERMMGYGQSAACRWKLLLDYFDETAEWEACGVCDTCRHPLEDLIMNPDADATGRPGVADAGGRPGARRAS